jgi:hypothetical protein
MPEPARAKPKPTPGTQHFWGGTQAGELRLQRMSTGTRVLDPSFDTPFFAPRRKAAQDEEYFRIRP